MYAHIHANKQANIHIHNYMHTYIHTCIYIYMIQRPQHTFKHKTNGTFYNIKQNNTYIRDDNIRENK